MQVVERSAIVTHTAAQMFALVADVARYPEFLPWCSGAGVEVVSDVEQLATVKISRGLIRSEFTTRNTANPGVNILMRLVRGPFSDLTGEWRFDAIGERGSRVHFRVEFDYKNRALAAAFGSAFEALCGTLVDAFVQRARSIYG